MTEQDLFEQFQAADKKIRRKTRFLLPRIKDSLTITYENIIFLLIGFVISCIIFFSLGVEKGRRDINREPATPTARVTHEEKPLPLKEGFAIQLAAFKTKGPAEEEMKRLRQEGFTAEVKRSGDYYQLYVGGFDKRNGAEKVLIKLRERYKDCYIKKI